jgi:hypothetical protein
VIASIVARKVERRCALGNRVRALCRGPRQRQAFYAYRRTVGTLIWTVGALTGGPNEETVGTMDSVAASVDEQFERWWQQYPRKLQICRFSIIEHLFSTALESEAEPPDTLRQHSRKVER